MPAIKKQRVAASGTAADAISISSSSSPSIISMGSSTSSNSQPQPRRSARISGSVASSEEPIVLAGAGPSAGTATATAPKPKKVTKSTKSRAAPVVLIPKSAPLAAKGKGKAKGQAEAVDVDAYDIDVVEDDAFAMALEFASPAPESRAPVPGHGKQNGSAGLLAAHEEDDDVIILPSSQMLMPSSQMLGTSSQGTGRSVWMADVRACEKMSEEDGVWVVEGYAGMEAVISNLVMDEVETSTAFTLSFEDMDGSSFLYGLNIVFDDLPNYPMSYETSISLTTPSPARRAHTRAFERFSSAFDLSVKDLITRLVSALQGDDNANGGTAEDIEDIAMGMGGDGDDDMFGDGPVVQVGRGFEVARGSQADLGRDWGKVKVMGYRPGLTRISDYWVVSYSIPLKSMAIDPNELAIWDDDLADAWADDQRFTLLMRVDRYGASYTDTKWSLALDKNYKPSEETITRHTLQRQRTSLSAPSRPFFLSDALATHLKVFPRSYQLRTSYPLNWDSADKYGMDDAQVVNIFHNQHIPVNEGGRPSDPRGVPGEENDPIEKGMEGNLGLVAFWWLCRRFVQATKYCLNCGVKVEVEGRRPYVCDKALCLYGMMCLGLGPSLSHTIQTHPGVVDLLLTFAHAAASSQTRMELPLKINIEVPTEAGIRAEPVNFDTLPEADQRRALVWLIESLPRVSAMQQHLAQGDHINKLPACPGALTVLRWAVGSCRAYLKETRLGEGVITGTTADLAGMPQYHHVAVSQSNIRQFSFVVGNPEQEAGFRREIEEAKKNKKTLEKYPTLLAFHGSGAERWHNILRTGLDFNEIACGRAYGNGVYFASDSNTSMSAYARPSTVRRPNADFVLTRATALTEIVNVPETFVSRAPYYVVNKVKQIKPFLLLVEGSLAPPEVSAVEGQTAVGDAAAVGGGGGEGSGQKMERKRSGKLFEHDPALAIKPTYLGQPLNVYMPDKIPRLKYKDTQPDLPADAALYVNPVSASPAKSNSKPKKPSYTPYPDEFYTGVTLLPPPSANSTQATKALMREWKGIMGVQMGVGGLPFWVRPDGDRLYSWTLEMFEFDKDSLLAKEMKQLKIQAVVAEVRFPASFPVSPPFMRIIYPRYLPFLQGGGGNITAGGSICNEILTATGWNPTYCVEAMVRDIMLNMTAAARIDMMRWKTPYGIQEAAEAYKRVAAQHQWEVPKDFDKIMMA